MICLRSVGGRKESERVTVNSVTSCRAHTVRCRNLIREEENASAGLFRQICYPGPWLLHGGTRGTTCRCLRGQTRKLGARGRLASGPRPSPRRLVVTTSLPCRQPRRSRRTGRKSGRSGACLASIVLAGHPHAGDGRSLWLWAARGPGAVTVRATTHRETPPCPELV